MLQNRVDPRGTLIKTTARGGWMGNRGVIHDEHQQIIRPFKLKAWLICLLDFKGRHRQVMSPDRYTELFFLDEATAFSAGHRPCAECRRKAFNRFKTLWLEANPEYGYNVRTPIWKIDEILHKERINRSGIKITYLGQQKDLPDGTFILHDDDPWLYAEGRLYRWTPGGYDDGIALPGTEQFAVLTPASIVNIFRAGYKPQMAVTPQATPHPAIL
jgi:hypothetical protein